MSSFISTRIWARIVLALVVLLVAATAYSIAGSRYGLVSYLNAFTWLRWIAQGGGALAAGSVVLAWLSWMRRDRRSAALAIVAAVVSTALSGTMAVNQAAPPPGPFINDITTDMDDPPRFEAVVPLRPEGSTSVEYGGPETAGRQRQVHPDVVPIETQLTPSEAYRRALDVAEDMGWDVVSARPDRGVIEAIDTTTFFRFKDDIVIRVRSTEKGSRVDVRSHSREGLTDLGKNAARIKAFSAAFSGR